MKKLIMCVALTLGCALAGESRTNEETSWGWSPIGLGIAAPAQLPFVESSVYGFRFGGFFGWNYDVYGLDLGLAEVCSGHFAGVQLCALSHTSGNAYGLQLGVLGNVVERRGVALQLGCVNIDSDEFGGVQAGLVNYTMNYAGGQFGLVNWNLSDAYGFQFGAVNVNRNEYFGGAFGVINHSAKFRGFDLGLINTAYEVSGFQLGLINACDHLKGVQFGLINMVCEGPLPIMVLANASF